MDIIPYGEHSHVKVLVVPHFELVHEGVKVELNSVDLTEFSRGVLATVKIRQSTSSDSVIPSLALFSFVMLFFVLFVLTC